MANSTARDISEFVALSGSFGSLGVELFAYEWGKSAEAQTCFIDQEGFESEVPASYRNPALQILTRGVAGGNPNDAYQVAQAIDEFLVSQEGDIELNGTRYVGGVFQSGSVGFIGRDEDGRCVYSANYYVFR